MKKLLFAIPLIAGASWAGASIYSGAQTQDAYNRVLEQLNEMQPFTIVNDTYAAGFLNSTAVTKVMESAASDAKMLFRLQHEIDHAPVAIVDSNVRFAAASMETTLLQDDLLPEYAGEFVQGFVDAEPLQIHTHIGFDGNTQNQLLVSAYHHQKNGVEVNFGGLDYKADIQGDALTGTGEIGELRVVGNGTVVTITPGSIKIDLKLLGQLVYAGFLGIEFDKLTISSDEGMLQDVILKSIAMNFESKLENDQLASRTRIQVGGIDSPLPLNTASLDLGVSNLSLPGLIQYVETVNQMSMSDSMSSAEPEMTQEMLSAFLPVIGPGTAVDYKIEFSNDGGSALLDYGISVIDESSPHYPAGGLSSIATLRDLLKVMQLEAHLNADVEAIDLTPLALLMQSPQAQELIVATGTSYAADITLNEMILDINGNPLSLEMMMGEMLDMPLADVLEM